MIRRWLYGSAALLCALVVPAPVAAHPFGPPPTATISAAGRTISIDWSATPDDAVAIGERLGVMPEGSVAAYRQESAAQVAPSSRDEARLSASPLLRDYLAEHIVAEQGGRPCVAEVPPIPDFVHTGARVVLTCPAVVDEVVLRITMLHDLNPAYRTVAVGEASDPAQSVFTASAPEHAWRFGVTGGAGVSGLGVPLAIGAGGGLVAAAAVVALRRRGRVQ